MNKEVNIYSFNDECYVYLEDYKKLQQKNQVSKQTINELTKQIAKLVEDKKKLKEIIDKAMHRIQLLQMDNEVTVRDLGLIVRDLKGDSNE